MKIMDITIISIGTLSTNALWGEKSPVRTGHATTTLIRAEGRAVLVDPGLPRQALAARLAERTGLAPDDITDVFLTSFHPECRRALPLFEHATWWLSATEREAIAAGLTAGLRATARDGRDDADADAGGDAGADPGDEDLRDAIAREGMLLTRCAAAPDHLLDGVDLYPLPGVTPGLTGLVIAEASRTTLICGDAVPSALHLARQQMIPDVWNLEKAKESMVEAMEVADILIPGRDNILVNPTERPF